MVLLAFAQLYGGLQSADVGAAAYVGTDAGVVFPRDWPLCQPAVGEWELLRANLLTLGVTFALLKNHGGQSLWTLVRRTLRTEKPRKFQVLDGGRSGSDDNANKWLN